MNQSFSKIWVVAVVGILVIAGIFCWQYFAMQEETRIPGDEKTEIGTINEQAEKNEQREKQEEIIEPEPEPEPEPESGSEQQCTPGEEKKFPCPDGTEVDWCTCERDIYGIGTIPGWSCVRPDKCSNHGNLYGDLYCIPGDEKKSPGGGDDWCTCVSNIRGVGTRPGWLCKGSDGQYHNPNNWCALDIEGEEFCGEYSIANEKWCTPGIERKEPCGGSAIAIDWCVCNNDGDWDCITSLECPTVCSPGEENKYTCSDGIEVDWCKCGKDGEWDCIMWPEAENECSNTCSPGEEEKYTCPDGEVENWCVCSDNGKWVCADSGTMGWRCME